MQKCPPFRKTEFKKQMKKLSEISNIDLEKEFTTTCPQFKGGRLSKNTQHGGVDKRHIRVAIYGILTILFTFNVMGNDATVREGIQMLINGQCSPGFFNMFGYSYFQNPVCNAWNNLIWAIANSIHGNTQAIGLLTKIIAAPTAGIAAIENLVDRVAPTLQSFKAITNSPKLQTIANSSKPKTTRKRRTKKEKESEATTSVQNIPLLEYGPMDEHIEIHHAKVLHNKHKTHKKYNRKNKNKKSRRRNRISRRRK